MATQADLVQFIHKTRGVAQTLAGMRGTLDFLDDEWGGTVNFNPAGVGHGTVIFDQATLDAQFGGPNVFTTVEWTNIQGAIASIKSAIGANAQIIDRLATTTIP